MRETHDEPRLEIPHSLAGRICLGFDEIQRRFLINAQTSPAVLSAQVWSMRWRIRSVRSKRRWIAAMLSGRVSQPATNTKMLHAETTALNRNGFATGAALLDALSSAPPDTGPSCIDTFLAAAIYLRTCSYELGRSTVTLRQFR